MYLFVECCIFSILFASTLPILGVSRLVSGVNYFYWPWSCSTSSNIPIYENIPNIYEKYFIAGGTSWRVYWSGDGFIHIQKWLDFWQQWPDNPHRAGVRSARIVWLFDFTKWFKSVPKFAKVVPRKSVITYQLVHKKSTKSQQNTPQ